MIQAIPATVITPTAICPTTFQLVHKHYRISAAVDAQVKAVSYRVLRGESAYRRERVNLCNTIVSRIDTYVNTANAHQMRICAKNRLRQTVLFDTFRYTPRRLCGVL